ncbi:anti-sigma factor [Neorhizobium sp. JUb45]|uniref:anti-sigma factor family protein n=1 Tax=unclassified Neorhizobium TaxID=2629175 RepID=UPI0010453C32|nr:anti-sigma factor [Neorhizobium sp. JUb45]TCR07081.1 anti-sigma factor RsiW [Neorhizobium sp. JUb45]
MSATKPVTDADLNAYVDGFLDAEDRLRVEQFLADNPDAATMLADWQSDNEALRAAFASKAVSRPGDQALVTYAGRPVFSTRRRLPAMVAAVLLIFAAGAAVGHLGPRLLNTHEIELTDSEILPQESKNAFLVYASEVRHPVEVFADEETHLATWLGKRLAIDKLKVPDLKPLGFKLVGGRLLPVDGRAGAMFMYEDGFGQRITVLVGRNADNRNTSFRFASADRLETFYWIDNALGYAVTGEISRDLLRRVAEECYRQFPS